MIFENNKKKINFIGHFIHLLHIVYKIIQLVKDELSFLYLGSRTKTPNSYNYNHLIFENTLGFLLQYPNRNYIHLIFDWIFDSHQAFMNKNDLICRHGTHDWEQIHIKKVYFETTACYLRYWKTVYFSGEHILMGMIIYFHPYMVLF